MKIARRGRQTAFIDAEGINLTGHAAFRDADERMFRIGPYRTLSDTPALLWHRIFRHVNRFLTSLPEDEQLQIGRFYITMQRRLRHTAGIIDAGSVVAEALDTLLRKLDLVTRMIHSVMHDSDIILPGLVIFSTTHFRLDRDDYVRFVVVGHLCKMLYPIWGEMLSHATIGFDDPDGLCACLAVLSSLRDDACVLAPILARLRAYVTTIADDVMDGLREPVSVPRDVFDRHVEAHLIVGLYPEIIQDTPAGTLWLMSGVKSSADALLCGYIVNQNQMAA